MAEQRRRMTYEEQRALHERQRTEHTVDRFTVDNYASGHSSGYSSSRTSDSSSGRSSSRSTSRSSSRSSRPSATSSASASSRQAGSRATHTASGATRHSTTRTASGATRHSATRTTTREQFSRQNYGSTTASRPPVFKIAIAAILVVAVVLIVRLCSAVLPITVTVNGTSYELHGAKTVQTALKTSGLPINPGDLISLNGNVLEKSAGEPFLASVNGTETADPNYGLRDGDVLNITDGNDIVEDYESEESPIPFGSSIVGIGAVHRFEAGTEGTLETRTGLVSGETLEKQIVDPIDATCTQYNLNTGADKVIAFTFDDGPSSEYTASVLNILAENDAKATFFVIGENVEEYPNLVKREYDEGHQVCTHTYDHADPVGGTDIGLMDAAGQIDEVVRGMQTIADATGAEASLVTRMPGGNLSEDMVMNLYPYLKYEIGWNIDTVDWTLPGAEAIYQEMISADPGDIILCHDGGGDRSQTVEALRRAIPYLKAKGFTFVTMDEILQYPASS